MDIIILVVGVIMAYFIIKLAVKNALREYDKEKR